MSELDVNEDASIYYDSGYWNDFDATQRMFNQRIAGGVPGCWFHDYFSRRGAPFTRALFLNCGNGWVEREMVADGVVGEASASTTPRRCSHEARREAAQLSTFR